MGHPEESALAEATRGEAPPELVVRIAVQRPRWCTGDRIRRSVLRTRPRIKTTCPEGCSHGNFHRLARSSLLMITWCVFLTSPGCGAQPPDVVVSDLFGNTAIGTYPLTHNIGDIEQNPPVIAAAQSYGMDAPTLNGIDVPKWKC